MKTKISYTSIFALAFPIMLGSAVQNIIAVSDSIFLYHYSDIDFQAISIASVFYLIISAVGFGFSRGGQILIARDHGKGSLEDIKKSFYTLIIFELCLAVPLFLLIQFYGEEMLGLFVNDQELLLRGVEYLKPRSWGIFCSYIGVGIVAYYTGISKPKFIVIDTIFLALINLLFNYIFIFGKFGFEAMGIAGAGFASSLAECSAFVLFIAYMIVERNPIVKNIFARPQLDVKRFIQIYRISINLVLQVIVGLGSWLIFFGIVENLGRNQLAVSNILRVLYLILSVPTWGFSSAMNTISSRLLGQNDIHEIIPTTHKVAILNVGITLLISIPVLVFPEQMLYPLFGKTDMSMIHDAQPLFYLLIVIMFLFSLSSTYFDSIIGLGKTLWGFYLKLFASIIYLLLLYIIVEKTNLGLKSAWAMEVLYWVMIFVVSVYFLFINNWKKEFLDEIA